MCDFSLQAVKSRPAKVGDKLIVHNFGTGTTGFAAIDDEKVAVCLLPGTEIAFESEFTTPQYLVTAKKHSKVAIFRQINKDRPNAHHDALETPDGHIVMLTLLTPDQHATVLQLPAAPKTEQEAQDQTRVAVAG